MPLGAGCPRCPSPVSDTGGTWRCVDHGEITPLWRPATADYDSFAEHLTRAGAMPTFLPWPVAPGWAVTDFGTVAEAGGQGRATLRHLIGAERARRRGGADRRDRGARRWVWGPGARACRTPTRAPRWATVRRWSRSGSPGTRSRCGRCSPAAPTFDRSVFAGEAHGRWLWLVLRPASAALLLKDEWILMNVGDLGPELVDLPFGGSPPAW